MCVHLYNFMKIVHQDIVRLVKCMLYIYMVCMVSACSVNKFIEEDEYLLNSAKVTYPKEPKELKEYNLRAYIQQQPNSKWFGMKIPLGVYAISGLDTTKWVNRLFRKIGEAPVIYDEEKTRNSATNMARVLANSGYLHANVNILTQKKKKKRLGLVYDIYPGERYYVKNISRNIEDNTLDTILTKDDKEESILRVNMPLDINLMNEERNRITSKLRSIGYYKFTKEDIKFRIDTVRGSKQTDMTINIGLHLENGRSDFEPHKKYYIGNINYLTESDGKYHFRKNFYSSNTLIRSGELYNDEHTKQTYSNFQRLPGVAFTSIMFDERPNSDTLDVRMLVSHARPYSIGADLEATNTAGDMGAAIAATISHKNIFRGSETASLKLREAYEAITGLEGYDGHHYLEFSAEAKLTFPSFLLPFVKKDWAVKHNSTSEISLQYNLQNRPEFHRRVLTGAWRYRWLSNRRRVSHRFDLLEVNYVYMPWMSSTFKEQYLDSLGKTNAILKYNYENLLITKMGYTYTYNSLGASQQTFGKTAHTFRISLETSGNMLRAATSIVNGKQNNLGQYTFCGIAYAQYVKFDFDYAKSFRLNHNNSLAWHIGFGIACPYGNSSILPFEKRYFAGGANSVRGWSVRALGPGRYLSNDKRINFINQSGDIKLIASMEMRTHLFWKIHGALFVDAGNVWTIRNYADQPNGQFTLKKIWDQIAVSYGLGFRFNMDFFILRFDMGMKAVNPAYDGKDHYPIYHPKLSRDFAFHFAVGMPF